jgi:hypothetical protein
MIGFLYEILGLVGYDKVVDVRETIAIKTIVSEIAIDAICLDCQMMSQWQISHGLDYLLDVSIVYTARHWSWSRGGKTKHWTCHS